MYFVLGVINIQAWLISNMVQAYFNVSENEMEYLKQKFFQVWFLNQRVLCSPLIQAQVNHLIWLAMWLQSICL